MDDAVVKMAGRPVADMIKEEIKGRAARLAAEGCTPMLATLRVGDDVSDAAYERGIARSAENVGIAHRPIVFDKDVDEMRYISLIEELSLEPSVHGIMPFRPIPKNIDQNAVARALDPTKDVDCLTDGSARAGFHPCTAEAVVEMIKFYHQEPLGGSHVVIAGRSAVVGRPLALMLLDEDCTVTIVHSKSRDLGSEIRRADIFVSAIGRARFFGVGALPSGGMVIDVGINDDGSGGICGDVDEKAAEISGVRAITPVPGGVGAITSAVILRHVVEACERNCSHHR